jgi:hypothetical protein
MGAKLQVDHRMTVLISEMTSGMVLNTSEAPIFKKW